MNISNAGVLVTGAVGGIGSSIVRQLGRRGAKLLVTDLSSNSLEQLVSELRRSGVRADAVAADVTRDSGRAELADAARRRKVNILVNVAGVNPFGLFEDQTDHEVAAAIEINTIAPMLLCRALLPILRENSPGGILNLGSSFGSIGYPGFAAYSASKFALHGFSEALRRELAGTGVTVQYVAPRATRTRLATDRIRAMNEELKVGMDSPEVVARSVVDALCNGRNETYLGSAERVITRLNGIWPWLIDRAVAKQMPIIRRYAAVGTGAMAPDQDSVVEIPLSG